MNYAILDLSGHVLYTTSSFDGRPPVPPEGCTVEEVSRVFPEQPSPWHRFHWPTQSWVDPRTLADLKANKLVEIKQARSLAEFGPFTYNGMVFDGNVDAQRRLAGYISVSKSLIAAGQDFTVPFTLFNNTEVTLTAQDFVGIELAKVQSVAEAFAHAVALRTQIAEATTEVELDSINW